MNENIHNAGEFYDNSGYAASKRPLDSGEDYANHSEDMRREPNFSNAVHHQDSKRAAIASESGTLFSIPRQSNNAPAFNVFKVLCPQLGIGAILGKGGSVINEICQVTGAKIKVTQSNEYFPETTDRVISLSGSIPSLEAVIDQVVGRISEVRNASCYLNCPR